MTPHPGILIVICIGLWGAGSLAAETGTAQEPPAALPPGLSRLPDGSLRFGNLTLHRQQREISFPARFALRKGPLEVVIATPSGRVHETLLTADVSTIQLQAMLYMLDLHNGPRLPGTPLPQGAIVDIDVAWPQPDGSTRREPVESWIRDERSRAPMRRRGWVFVGSTMRDGHFLADVEGNVCINYSVGATILDSPDPESTDDTLFVVNEDREMPALDTEVTVYIVPRKSGAQ